MTINLLLSFFGGALGALCGALPIFIVFGVLVTIGALISLSGSSDFLHTIAFGALFSPHIAFAGGVAASAYARKLKLLKSGKDLNTPLISLPGIRVIALGGLFGTGGALLAQSFVFLKLPLDTVALAVFVSNGIARILFATKSATHRAVSVWGRFTATKSTLWLPWQSPWPHTVLVGVILGGVFSQMALTLNTPFLGFGLAVTSLIFVQFGAPFPVTHHIALIAGLAALQFSSLGMGLLFGLFAALAAEVSARLWHASADTHVDPPAFAIAIGSLCLSFFL